MKLRKSYLLLLAVVPICSAASAAVIPGLVGTGFGSIGSADPNWQITADASGGTVPRAATIISPLTGTSPFNWYVPGSGNWIGPNTSSDFNPGVPDGTYEYTLQFDLTGYDPSSASFVYETAADNDVFSGTLNGNAIPIDTRVPGGGNQYHTLSGPLDVNSGFESGINTLVFDVNNTTPNPSPTGFYLTVDSSVATAVPEPTSLGLLGVGAFAMLRRRRQA
ncbi:MAG: PEP-CTERM sorting domain-containing protein [Tepidisphaeraceae bacterium]|jgi:hypothetical protein